MDHLVAPLVAEELLDLPGMGPLDLLHFTCRVVDEPARELAAVGRDAADAVPNAERPLDGAHPGGQEAPTALRERALGAVVEVQGAGGLQRVRDPVLAAGERIALGEEERAELERGIEDSSEDALTGAVRDDGRDAGGGRRARRGELGGHAARADLARRWTRGAGDRRVVGTRDAHGRGPGVEPRVAGVDPVDIAQDDE